MFRPTLCFTLDDGYADQLHQLVPIFLRYQAKPTLYVLTDLVDGKDWPWDAKLAYCIWESKAPLTVFQMFGHAFPVDLSSAEHKIITRRRLIRWAKSFTADQLDILLPEVVKQFDVVLPVSPPADYIPANWHDLREFEAMGLRIGCHGKNHRVLNSLCESVFAKDLLEANQRLSVECKSPSRVFCYPSGSALDFSSKHFEWVRQAGFTAAVTTLPRMTDLKGIKNNPFAINRLSMPPYLDTFKRNCSWFDYLRG